MKKYNIRHTVCHDVSNTSSSSEEEMSHSDDSLPPLIDQVYLYKNEFASWRWGPDPNSPKCWIYTNFTGSKQVQTGWNAFLGNIQELLREGDKIKNGKIGNYDSWEFVNNQWKPIHAAYICSAEQSLGMIKVEAMVTSQWKMTVLGGYYSKNGNIFIKTPPVYNSNEKAW